MFYYISECNLPMLGCVLVFKCLGVQEKLRFCWAIKNPTAVFARVLAGALAKVQSKQ